MDKTFLANVGVTGKTNAIRHLQDKNRAKGFKDEDVDMRKSPYQNFTKEMQGPHQNLIKVAHLSNAQRAVALAA